MFKTKYIHFVYCRLGFILSNHLVSYVCAQQACVVLQESEMERERRRWREGGGREREREREREALFYVTVVALHGNRVTKQGGGVVNDPES